MSTDLSHKLYSFPHSFSLAPSHTHKHTHKYAWKVRTNVKMSREKWQTAVSNKITVLIIHRFPTSSDSFPFISPCSNGWHQAFVKVKVAWPTSSVTTDQFFHFFRFASLLLLSVQFHHLEEMPKCKASRDVREISLINARPLHRTLNDFLLSCLVLYWQWCK